MTDPFRDQVRRVFEERIQPPSSDLSTRAFASLPVGLAPAPSFIAQLRHLVRQVVRHWLGLLSVVGAVALIAGVLLTSSPAYAVYVGYADSRSANGPKHFPSPWMNSARVTFIGSGPEFDGGAIRIDNLGTQPITVEQVSVDAGSRHFALWPSPIQVQPGATLILAQTELIRTEPLDTNFDTSEVNPKCSGSAPVAVIHLTIDGRKLDLKDDSQVLTTGGHDLGLCPGHENESHDWQRLGP